MATLAKVKRYANEMRHCWQLGATTADRASLAFDTLAFHLQNARGNLASTDTERVRHCRIRLAARGTSPIDFSYRLRGGDLFIFHEVLLDRCYTIPPALVPGVVRSVVDFGANIGSATLSFSTQFPEASFICVEPNPDNARVLAGNVAFLGARARVLEAAVSDCDGEAEFATTGVAWQGRLEAGGSNTIRVACYSLPTLLERMNLGQIDVLKVDIEGAESKLFASRGEHWKKVALIIAELHGHYGLEEFSADMDAIGFRTIPPGGEYGNVMPVAVRGA